MRPLLLLLFLILAGSCADQEKSVMAEQAEEHEPKLDHQEVPDQMLAVGDTTDHDIDGNLYGRFFCDRAEFYVIHSPQNRIQYSGVKTLTMCYLDGELGQTRYVLESDITAELVEAFGNFTIGGYDMKNREIIKARKILVKTDQGYQLSDELDNIELKWKVGEMLITYRKNIHDSHQPFVYTERLSSYDKEFKQIERYCI